MKVKAQIVSPVLRIFFLWIPEASDTSIRWTASHFWKAGQVAIIDRSEMKRPNWPGDTQTARQQKFPRAADISHEPVHQGLLST